MSSQQNQLYLRWKVQRPEKELTELHTCSTYIQYSGFSSEHTEQDSLHSIKHRKEKDTKQHTQAEIQDRIPAEIPSQRREAWRFPQCREWTHTWNSSRTRLAVCRHLQRTYGLFSVFLAQREDTQPHFGKVHIRKEHFSFTELDSV